LKYKKFRSFSTLNELTRIANERQKSVDQFIGGLLKLIEVRLAVVVHHEAVSLLEDEPDCGPDRDAGEGAEQLLNLTGSRFITNILNLEVEKKF
jgi:hypothetical protein